MAATHQTCRLKSAIGFAEGCPGAGCPFWEPGGAVLEGRCAFEELDISGNPQLAGWLLQIRERLESARTLEAADDARRLFRRLLNESGGEQD